MGVISEITNTNVSKLKSERESFVAVQTIDNENVRKTKEIELVQIVSETSKLTSEIAANANANATNYRTETSNLREQLLGEILDYEQETQTLANAIKAKTELLRIENEAQIKRILAEAERAANVTVAEAEKYAYLNRTAALEVAYKNLKSELALGGEDFNVLSFIRSIEMHKEDKLHMDLQKPTALNLPGQNDKYLESLKSGYTRL